MLTRMMGTDRKTQTDRRRWRQLPFGRRGRGLKTVMSAPILRIKFMSASCEIVFTWMLQNTFDDKFTLIQAMAWCCQATSHYWANVDSDRCCHIASLGHKELSLPYSTVNAVMFWSFMNNSGLILLFSTHGTRLLSCKPFKSLKTGL